MAQFGILNLYHGFMLPHFRAQQPTADDLFGGEAMVVVTAVKFEHKVACKGVEGGYAVVVNDLACGQRVGLGTIKGG